MRIRHIRQCMDVLLQARLQVDQLHAVALNSTSTRRNQYTSAALFQYTWKLNLRTSVVICVNRSSSPWLD